MEINSTSGVCNPCKLGFFKNVTGNHVQCYECPVNYTTRHVESTSISECNPGKSFYRRGKTLLRFWMRSVLKVSVMQFPIITIQCV